LVIGNDDDDDVDGDVPVDCNCYYANVQVSIDVPVRISQQRHPTSSSTTVTGSCHDNTLPSDGRDVAAAAAVISAAVGKQLFDGGTSSSSTQQQPSNGNKNANSGNNSKRDPAGSSGTKAKSEIQKFYQIKEKVGLIAFSQSTCRMEFPISHVSSNAFALMETNNVENKASCTDRKNNKCVENFRNVV